MNQQENTLVLRRVSPQNFATLGMEQLAYIKSIKLDGKESFAIHAADGTPLTVMADKRAAYAAVRQNDMEPHSVH